MSKLVLAVMGAIVGAVLGVVIGIPVTEMLYAPDGWGMYRILPLFFGPPVGGGIGVLLALAGGAALEYLEDGSAKKRKFALAVTGTFLGAVLGVVIGIPITDMLYGPSPHFRSTHYVGAIVFGPPIGAGIGLLLALAGEAAMENRDNRRFKKMYAELTDQNRSGFESAE
jgi:MFS family permease